MSDEAIDTILHRLQSDGQLIEKMLQEDRRERYFEALRAKRNDRSTSNVTAAFFADPTQGAFVSN